MIAKSVSLLRDSNDDYVVTAVVERSQKAEIFRQLNLANELLGIGKPVEVTFGRHRVPRSLDANGYFWTLCGKIAEKIGGDKNEVYRQAIKDAGRHTLRPVKDDQLEEFAESWARLGVGFFAEKWQPCKMEGYTYMMEYWGSHTYDTAEMSRLIDLIVADAQDLGIETRTPEEINNLISLWGEER